MTLEQTIDALQASPDFCFMQGMLTNLGVILGAVDDDEFGSRVDVSCAHIESGGVPACNVSLIPESASHPATLGCLLHLARKRLGDLMWYPEASHGLFAAFDGTLDDTEFVCLAHTIIDGRGDKQ